MPPLPELTFRLARPEDAPAASEVICASIRRLCAADHQGDPDAIASWLSNKSPDGLAAMIDDPFATVWLAERERSIVAVGQTTRPGHAEGAGKITLNYVVPAARHTGASSETPSASAACHVGARARPSPAACRRDTAVATSHDPAAARAACPFEPASVATNSRAAAACELALTTAAA